MENKDLTIDRTRLTPEQRSQLAAFEHNKKQIQTLEDIADMTQEVVNLISNWQEAGTDEKMGALLLDIRESLQAIKDKKAPETPDNSKVIVDAVSKLEKSLEKAIKAIDVKPQVTVDAPQVNVSPPGVDLKGIEKVMGTIPKAFKEAIALIPVTEIPETPDRWDEVLSWLESIDTASRMKPQIPNTLKVTNADGSSIGSVGGAASQTVQSSVSVTNSNTNVLDSNASRIGATIYNEGSATCYMRLGPLATTTTYTIQIASGGYYELPYSYTGTITGITSASTAQLRVTELT